MGRRMVGSVVCWLVVGCGPDGFPSAGEALSIGDETDGETEGEAEDLTHGVIKLQFARSPSSPDSPFVGTAQIQVTMTYDSCFTQFYDANPNYTQEGVAERDRRRRLCQTGRTPRGARRNDRPRDREGW